MVTTAALRLNGVTIGGFCLLAAVAPSPADAQKAASFEAQSISMLIGFAAGGGVDATGRVMAPLLARYLSGRPAIVPRYMPGAGGVVAFNYIVQQTKPDGLLYTVAASDPVVGSVRD
jgi:tripartite-type tricarboxylate transporter receptor subunit TctC